MAIHTLLNLSIGPLPVTMVLYVVSGAQEGALVGLPQDNFNGITVAASDRFQGAGETWRQEASFNVGFLFDAVGDRTSTDLLAPGVSNFLTSPGDLEEFSLGTSFAAPHVTGAAALLHQYANTKIAASLPRWGNEAHFHEVTKAILLNSADKLNGVHGSERDVVNELGHTWLATLAYSDDETSLDQRLGAGHLNVESAIANFESGEYDPGLVPPIGWDFGGIGAFGDVDYTFNQSVSGYVAITLAWDRRVELTDPDNSYSSGDLFFDYVELDEVLNDLNVYLLPANTADLGMALTSSRTVDDNLEHIFYEVPAGNYKIKVLHSGGLNDAQDYALAWWAGELSPPVTPGDFDEDGDVDGADFLLWQRNTSVGSLTDWQANYGTGVGPLTAATAVPEPCAAILGSRLAWLCAAS